jgi:DNA-binding PadR family transcriptional regulator
MRHRFWDHHEFGGDFDFRLMRRHKGEGKGHGGRHGSRHGHRRGGFGRGFGGGGRFFDHGELRHVVLALLAEQPRHGYDIIRAIDQRTGGAYSPSPGVIYPTLQLLEDVGYAAPATGDDARNSYQITQQGRAFLDENSALIGDIMSRMQRLGRSQAAAFPAIVGAMDNLKSALRSGTEPWTEAQARAVAAAIDIAADSIRAQRNPADGATKK